MISFVAFAAIFLAAVFLFIRNYPSDRWFSVVFIVAGGVLAWNTEAEDTETNDTETETKDTETETETEAEETTKNTIK
jgi:Ca2+-dependent lipid-binding protein